MGKMSGDGVVDTPQTVITSRAHVVLKTNKDKDLHHVELLLKVSPTYQLSGSQHVLVTALQQTLIEKYFNQIGPDNFCLMYDV